MWDCHTNKNTLGEEEKKERRKEGKVEREIKGGKGEGDGEKERRERGR